MPSQRKIDAARANGAKSRGPVSPAGKARSARNATKHGLASPHTSAASVCLHTESPASFAAVHQALIDEFQPNTASEALLIEEMAVARFRLRRAWADETALTNRAIARGRRDRELEARNAAAAQPNRFIAPPIPVTDPQTESALAFVDLARGTLPILHRYEARLSSQFDRALRRLLALRAATDTVDPAESGPAPSPEPVAEPVAVDEPAPALAPAPAAETLAGPNEPNGAEPPTPPTPCTTPEPRLDGLGPI